MMLVMKNGTVTIKRKFECHLAIREGDFKHFLKTHTPVSHHIVDNMLFVPVGTYKRSRNNPKPFRAS